MVNSPDDNNKMDRAEEKRDSDKFGKDGKVDEQKPSDDSASPADVSEAVFRDDSTQGVPPGPTFVPEYLSRLADHANKSISDSLVLMKENNSLQNHITILSDECWKLRADMSKMHHVYTQKMRRIGDRCTEQLRKDHIDHMRTSMDSHEKYEAEKFKLMQETKKWKEACDEEKRRGKMLSAELEQLKASISANNSNVPSRPQSAPNALSSVNKEKSTKYQPFRRVFSIFQTREKKEVPTLERLYVNAEEKSSTYNKEMADQEKVPLIPKTSTATSDSPDDEKTAVASKSRHSLMTRNPRRSPRLPTDGPNSQIIVCGSEISKDVRRSATIHTPTVAPENTVEQTVIHEMDATTSVTHLGDLRRLSVPLQDPFVTPESDCSRESHRLLLQEALEQDFLHKEAVARMMEG